MPMEKKRKTWTRNGLKSYKKKSSFFFFIKLLYNKDKCHETSVQPSCSFNIQGMYRKYMMLGKKRVSVECRRWDSYNIIIIMVFSY